MHISVYELTFLFATIIVCEIRGSLLKFQDGYIYTRVEYHRSWCPVVVSLSTTLRNNPRTSTDYSVRSWPSDSSERYPSSQGVMKLCRFVQ